MWPTYLFVTGSIILLQCLSIIHKSGTNLCNEEIWRLLRMEQMPTFGELDDKNTGPNHWKRNKLTWHLLQKCAVCNELLNITHTLGAAVLLFDPWTKQSVKKQTLTVWTSENCLLTFTFLVSTNASWFHSYLRTPSSYHRLVKKYFNSHCQKKFFSK